jgi:VanZ family protein
MKDFLKNNYHKHLGIGFLIGVLMALLLNNLTDYIVVIIALFIGYCAGIIWEGEQTFKYNNDWDWNDVFFSAIGSGIGSLIILFL